MMSRRTVKPFALAALLLLGSATLVAAASDAHHDPGVLLRDFLYRVLNFVILAGALAYFVTKPIIRGLKGRREKIAADLEQARSAREEAEAKFREYDQKLSRAAAEIEEVQTALRREGEMERDRILAAAREMAEKIRREAEKAAANEIARARSELREEASRMAVAIAEELLKKNFTAEDQSRLVKEYIQKVGELH